MITVRHAAERGAANLGWLDSRHTFSLADSDSVNLGSNPGPPATNRPYIVLYFKFRDRWNSLDISARKPRSLFDCSPSRR